MWLKIGVLSLFSSLAYRLGGKGGFPNAKLIRRIGCSLIALVALWLLVGFNWIILIASILCSACYRLGGKGGFPNAKLIRRIGCSLIALVALWLLVGFKLSCWWAYLLVFGLQWGALSTYFDFVGQDSFYLHGFAIGLACLPLLWAGYSLWLILARSLVLGLFMGLWSKYWGWDTAEEVGRGAAIILTLPILLI